MRLSNYTPIKSLGQNKALETIRTIKIGDVVSICTNDKSIFAKLEAINGTHCILQPLRHNFELNGKAIRLTLSKITSIKKVSSKSGLGAIIS